MGRDHARILATSAAADLVGCFDVDPAAAERVPPGIPFSTELEPLLDTPGLEALFVVSPQRFHEEHIRAGLERGLHIFSEKPMADSLESADRIVAMGEANPGRLVFGHMMRFDPRWNALRHAVADGRLGKLVHLSNHGFTPDYEGRALADRISLVNENAIHGLDLLQWLGGPIERVYGEVSRTGVAGEGLIDAAAATLRFRSGAIGTLETDWAMPSATGASSQSRTIVVGSDGRRMDRRARLRRRDPLDPGGAGLPVDPRLRRSGRRPAGSLPDRGRVLPREGPRRARVADRPRRRPLGAGGRAGGRALDPAGRPVTVAEMGWVQATRSARSASARSRSRATRSSGGATRRNGSRSSSS